MPKINDWVDVTVHFVLSAVATAALLTLVFFTAEHSLPLYTLAVLVQLGFWYVREGLQQRDRWDTVKWWNFKEWSDQKLVEGVHAPILGAVLGVVVFAVVVTLI